MRRTPGAGEMPPSRARAILGVAPDAPTEEIEAAFRRAMRVAHPDRGGDHGRAQLLLDARRCLRGPDVRRRDDGRRVVVVPAPTWRDRVTALLARLRLRHRPTRAR